MEVANTQLLPVIDIERYSAKMVIKTYKHNPMRSKYKNLQFKNKK